MDFPPEDQLYGKELIFGRVYGREADREPPFEISRASFKTLIDILIYISRNCRRRGELDRRGG